LVTFTTLSAWVASSFTVISSLALSMETMLPVSFSTFAASAFMASSFASAALPSSDLTGEGTCLAAAGPVSLWAAKPADCHEHEREQGN
jgi:hypothetical protein